MKNFNQIIAGCLAAGMTTTLAAININPAEAKPKNVNDNEPTITGKIREGWNKTKPQRRQIDRKGGDIIQNGQDTFGDFKRARNERKLRECNQSQSTSKKCKNLRNKQ